MKYRFDNDTPSLILVVLMLAVMVAAIAGWVMNIFKLMDADGITVETIVRVIGIFLAPLGGIVGWF